VLKACFAVILENEEDAEEGHKKEPHLKVVLRRKDEEPLHKNN
jgi:hypothetical protein